MLLRSSYYKSPYHTPVQIVTEEEKLQYLTSYYYNSEFYLENRKKFFCLNVNKNAKEKLSSGFGVTKIKTDATRACFPNSWCNQPPPLQR